MSSKCLIAIGCNQGDCHENIRSAMNKVESLPDSKLLTVSSLLETTPVGSVQGTFLNGALLIETDLRPDDLMTKLLAIEKQGGRDRTKQPGNRPIDLDLLLFAQQRLDSEHLAVPHPRMTFRRFVLQPAVEIAPDMVHPVAGITLADLWHQIQTERNVVAVLADKKFPVEQIDAEAGPAIDGVKWLVPGQSRELLAALRRTVSQNDGWLIVLSHDPQMLANLKGAIKLLVTVGELSAGQQKFVDNYSGPYWNQVNVQPDALQNDLMTAIESMKPVERP